MSVWSIKFGLDIHRDPSDLSFMNLLYFWQPPHFSSNVRQKCPCVKWKSISRADVNDIYITHSWSLDREATTTNLKPKCHPWTRLGFREVCWSYSCSSVDTLSWLMILEPFLYKHVSGRDWQIKNQISLNGSSLEFDVKAHAEFVFYAALCQRQYSIGPLAMRTDLIESEEYK